MVTGIETGNLLVTGVSSIASGLSLSYGVMLLLGAQYLTAALLCGLGVYFFGWACAKR